MERGHKLISVTNNFEIATRILTNIVRMIKSRRLRWAGHVARMEESRSALKLLASTSAGKRPLGRPMR